MHTLDDHHRPNCVNSRVVDISRNGYLVKQNLFLGLTPDFGYFQLKWGYKLVKLVHQRLDKIGEADPYSWIGPQEYAHKK